MSNSRNKGNAKHGKNATPSRFHEFSSLSSFISSQLRALTHRKQHTPQKVDVFDFEEVEDGICFSPSQDSLERCTPRSLRSSVFVLKAKVPKISLQLKQMDLLLLDECPDMESIRKCAWNGCTTTNRAQVWRILTGYEPLSHSGRVSMLEARRKEYHDFIALLISGSDSLGADDDSPRSVTGLDDSSSMGLCRRAGTILRIFKEGSSSTDSLPQDKLAAKTLRQIDMDLPRTHPQIPIFRSPEIRDAMRRILYIFGVLHPSKNYVQGMNEILTPILAVFFSHYLEETDKNKLDIFLSYESLDTILTLDQLRDAEADSFWTFTSVITSIGDSFVSDQPGIMKRIARLEAIVRKVDPELGLHLAKHNIEFIQFSFRWMNCLLLRELPLRLILKAWDAFLAEEDGFSELHVYFCSAMVTSFSVELMEKNFEESILFLQSLPTDHWNSDDIDVLLSQAQTWRKELKFPRLSQTN